MSGAVFLAYGLAAAVGGIVGTAELVSRYRDAPLAAVTARGGVTYVVFNALVSLLGMYLIRNVFPFPHDDLSVPPGDVPTLARQVFAAGLGAMVVLRSAVVTVRSGSADVPIGPAAVVEIFRHALDRDVDRARAGPRAGDVRRIMADVSFVRAHKPLGDISLSLLQNVSPEEAARLSERISALASQTGRSDSDKAIELGLILAGSVGFAAVDEARKILGDRIGNRVTRPKLVAELLGDMDVRTVQMDLALICMTLNPEVPLDEQASLASQIKLLADNEALSSKARVLCMGLLLVNAVGEETLEAAVGLLRPSRAVGAELDTAPAPSSGGLAGEPGL